MDLSIIVVSYNTRDLLRTCLESLCAAVSPPAGCEIVVVDNGSTDGSGSMVAQQFPGVRLLELGQNLGFSAANNRGVAASRGEYVLFLNSDTEVTADSLTEPLRFMQSDPVIGALTVRLLYPNGRRDPDNHRGFPTPWNAICHFTGLSKLFPQSKRFNGYFAGFEDLNRTHAVDVIAGSYMMMPRFLFERLGGWDESYFFYGEDIDFCYRIRQAGYQIYYYPHVDVLHHKGASSGLRKESAALAQPARETRVKIARESIRAMKIFYKKFYKEQYPRWVTGVVLSGIEFRGRLRILKHELAP